MTALSCRAVVFENPDYSAWRFGCDFAPNGWRSGNYESPEKAEAAAKQRFKNCEVTRGEDPQIVRARGAK